MMNEDDDPFSRSLRARTRQLVLVVLGAVVFGVAMAVLKGNGSGIREEIGNLSAPWLLVPFVASAAVGDGLISRSVLVGIFSSLLALIGFYFANSIVLQLGPHPWFEDVWLAISGGRRWYELALVSGPLFGAVGGLWRRSHQRVFGACVFALLICEPIAQWALKNKSVGGFSVSAPNPAVWLGETVVGLAACAAIVILADKKRGWR
jgi:hypothetical protein